MWVSSGVPQGSVLGPLIILLYIYFVNSNIISTTRIFADDVKLYVNIEAGTKEEVLTAVETVRGT